MKQVLLLLRKPGLYWLSCFIILFICSVPYQYSFLPDPGKLLHKPFEYLAGIILHHVLHLSYAGIFLSDSASLYIHLIVLSLISLIVASIVSFAKKDYTRQIGYWLALVVRYYLIIILLIYGFDKLFKTQFYLPEPNTLYTAVGDMHKDILYWTTMGASRSYTMFCGILEIAAALLLLFQRTIVFGAAISFAVLLNVVVLNFSYDISVKIFSSFLLLLSIVLLSLYIKPIAAIFFQRNYIREDRWQPAFMKHKKKWAYCLKGAMALLLLADGLFPYVRSHNFNDDAYHRPPFHGAYAVTTFVQDGDTIPLLNNTTVWKNVFVHRDGYFIIKQMNDAMQDYKLVTDTITKDWQVYSYTDTTINTTFSYRLQGDSLLQLSGEWFNHDIEVTLKQQPLNNLPLMQKEFNWIVDE